MRRALATLLLLSSVATAHTAIVGVTPAEGQTVAAPKEVIINFNEPVSLRFSTFKVYPLEADGSTLTVNRAAAKLAKGVLNLKTDLQARADLPITDTGNLTSVRMPLKDKLKSGPYVVMWRILSADGHPITGQYVFRIK